MNVATLPVFLSAAMGFLAFLGSLSLFIQSRTRSGLPGCGSGSSCDQITTGRWSRVGPISVAFLGCMVYAFFLLDVLAANAWPVERSIRDTLDHAQIVLAWTIFGAAIWFMAIQAVILRRWCLYCTAVHCLALLASLQTILGVTDKTSFILNAGTGILAVFVLILLQLLLQPRLFRITTLEVQPDAEPTEKAESAALGTSRPSDTETKAHLISSRLITLSGGRVKLDVAKWPLLGSSSASKIVAVLLDFTCEECNRLHHLLSTAVSERPESLAVLIVPVPMHPNCNPDVKCRNAEQSMACPFARLVWAMFETSRARYDFWLRFLSESPDGQPFGLALIKAAELANLSPFNIREPDATLDEKLSAAIAVRRAAQMPTLPALLIPDGMVQGRIEDVARLRELLSL